MLISLSRMKGQKIDDVKTNLMKSTVLAMSTAIAVSLAGSVIYFVVLFRTQSSEIPDSFRLASLLGSAVLVIWTTSTFWAEVKKLETTKKEAKALTSETGDKGLTRPNLPMTLQVELPVERWGQRTPVKMTISGGTILGELVSKIVREHVLPPDRTWYVDTGSQLIGPEHYRGTLEASGIKDGQTIVLTDKPLGQSVKLGEEEAELIALEAIKKKRPESGNHKVESAKLSEGIWSVSGYCREGQDSTRFEVHIDAASGKVVGTNFRTHVVRVG